MDYPGGQIINKVRFPPSIQPVIRNNAPYYNYDWQQIDNNQRDIGSDDLVTLYNQYSTHWDSLAHRGSLFDIEGNGEIEPVYYNGYKAGVDIVIDENNNSHARKLGIEHMAEHGVQGRAVLIDLYSDFGRFPRVEVGYNDVVRIMGRDGIEIEKGDIVCFWTGLDQLIMESKGSPDGSITKACAVLDGNDPDLLDWITNSGIAAIVSDNLAIEAVGKKLPEETIGSVLPLHEHCLFKLGLHLGELWYLAELATWLKDHHRFRFLLTAPPLRLTGAVGSPVTPIATV